MSELQDTLLENGPDGEELDDVVQLKNRREAILEFRLTKYQLYEAVRRGELRRVQLGGKGRVYYLEDELKALSERVVQPWVRRVA